MGTVATGASWGEGISMASTGIGGAVNDLYAAKGDKASAASYAQAAQIATTNSQIAQNSEKTNQLQIQRQISQVGGSQEAALGMGNMAESGSGLDVMRESMQQGAIAKSEAAQQGTIQVQGYQQQAQQYQQMEDAANSAAHGSEVAGALQIVGTAAAIAFM